MRLWLGKRYIGVLMNLVGHCNSRKVIESSVFKIQQSPSKRSSQTLKRFLIARKVRHTICSLHEDIIEASFQAVILNVRNL